METRRQRSPSGLGGSEEASAGWEAGRRAPGCSTSVSADRGGRAGREGRGEQTSRTAQPRCHSAAWRPRAPIRTLGALEPRPPSAEGRALAGGSNADQPGENNLLGPSSPEQLILRCRTPVGWEVSVHCSTSPRGFGERRTCPCPTTSSREPALPSPFYLEPDSNQPLYTDPHTKMRNQVHFTFYKPWKFPSSLPIMPKQRRMGHRTQKYGTMACLYSM